MDNEARLTAMRWAAEVRLAMNKGDRWDKRRDEFTVELVDREFKLGRSGFVLREASALSLDCDMEVAFERIGEGEPAEEKA